MTEKQDEHAEQDEQQLEEARQTLQILQEIRAEQDHNFKSKPHTPEDLEYHLISTEQDFLSVIKQNAEKNPKIWTLYQQQKTGIVDIDQFARRQAELKYSTETDKKCLQLKTQLSTISNNVGQTISPANDDLF